MRGASEIRETTLHGSWILACRWRGGRSDEGRAIAWAPRPRAHPPSPTNRLAPPRPPSMPSQPDAHLALQDLASLWQSAQADVVAHVGELAARCTELIELRKGLTGGDAEAIDPVIDALQGLLLTPKEAEARTRLSCTLELLLPELGFAAPRGDSELPPLDPQAVQVFLDDRLDSLDELDDHALEYEHSASASALAGIKRILHSIKGDASLLGLNDVAECCHDAEDRLTTANRAATAELIASTVRFLRARFEGIRQSGDTAAPTTLTRPALESKPVAPTAVTAPKPAHAVEAPAPDDISEVDGDLAQEFLAEAREHLEQVDAHLLNLENGADGSKDEALNAVFRAFHT